MASARESLRAASERELMVRHLFQGSPRLARETGFTLEVHRKALQSARAAIHQR